MFLPRQAFLSVEYNDNDMTADIKNDVESFTFTDSGSDSSDSMDDVIVLAETKEQLQEWKERIEAFLRDELFLDLNDKTCIRPVSMGIEFVGVRIYATHMKLRKSTVGRLKREVKKITEMYATGEMSKEDFDRRVASIKGLLEHTQSASLRGRLNLIYRDTMQKYGKPTGPETDIWKGTYEEKKLARSVRKAA